MRNRAAADDVEDFFDLQNFQPFVKLNLLPVYVMHQFFKISFPCVRR